MKLRFLLLIMISLVSSSLCLSNEPTVQFVTHEQLQAVNQDGEGAYNPETDTDKVIIEGIVLNNPEYMVNPTPGTPGFMGGQWQIYVQGEDEDHAGTAVWLGQYYARVSSSDSYDPNTFVSELERINYDDDYPVTAGDRVRVTGWYKFYNGKTNVNEKHSNLPMFDFKIEVLKKAAGLPQPETIQLEDVKNQSDEFIFDHTRQSGAEYYQGRRVRVNNVSVVDPNWAPGKQMIVEDANGLTIPIRLGVGTGFSRFECPNEPFDLIGVFDQESSDWTDGYRIWVTDYDGNGYVLTSRDYTRGNLPGDINYDYKVDLKDLARFGQYYLESMPGLNDPNL